MPVETNPTPRLYGQSYDCSYSRLQMATFNCSVSGNDVSRTISRRRPTASTTSSPPPLVNDRIVNQTLSDLAPVTADDVMEIQQKSPAKQCKLDPVPTWLVKRASHILAPVIATVCNASFQQLTFPCRCKNAVARPLLMKRTPWISTIWRCLDPSSTSASCQTLSIADSHSTSANTACFRLASRLQPVPFDRDSCGQHT